MAIAGSSNGRTAAFEAVNLGSIPSPAALTDIVVILYNSEARYHVGLASIRDQFGKATELHHDQQKAERLVPMQKETHRGKGFYKLHHSGKPLPGPDRETFPSQKNAIWRAQAEEYLGAYWLNAFEELILRKMEEDGEI
jgi:hypothetical protein